VGGMLSDFKVNGRNGQFRDFQRERQVFLT
jgi:hypothetical protein